MGIIIIKRVKRKLFQAGFFLNRLLWALFQLSGAGFVKLVMYKHGCKESHKLELETSSKWSEHLPEDILELILQRLCLKDYLCFGVVCSSWRYVVTKAIANKHCSPAPQLPLLMFCPHPYAGNDYHSFLNLSDRRVHVPNQPKLYRRNCIGSVEGWLIMTDGIAWRPEGLFDFWSPLSSFSRFEKVKNFFLNPVSGARVMLPSQSTIPCPESSNVEFLVKVVTSGVSNFPNSCIVAALCATGDLVVCRPSDKTWTLIEKERDLCFCDIEIHDGKLYAITLKCTKFIMVMEIRITSLGFHVRKAKTLEMLHPQPAVYGSSRREGETVYLTNIAFGHLVHDSASNELLLILRITDCAYKNDCWICPLFLNFLIPQRSKWFSVFKLDKSGPRWVQVKSLGDRILFLGSSNCKLIPTTTMKDSQEELKGNCIYFAFDSLCTKSLSLGRDVGIFSIADGSIKRNLPNVSRSWLVCSPIWFTPKPW